MEEIKRNIKLKIRIGKNQYYLIPGRGHTTNSHYAKLFTEDEAKTVISKLTKSGQQIEKEYIS